MENSIDCKIGNFQTESNVIMLHKHSNKSKLYKKKASNILDSITRKCYYTNNSYWKTMKKEKL